MMATRFLPMSCRSPFTVPMQMTPFGWRPLAAKIGSINANPLFIARAATSSSGT